MTFAIDKSRVFGFDISFYQNDDGRIGRVDFHKMWAGGPSFLICRAGQNDWPDPLFKEYWTNSKGILPRGSYWFYDSRKDPKRQAELWVSLLGSDLGELPLMMDFEETYNGPFKGWKNWYDFRERVKFLTHKTTMVYTGVYYWRDNSPDPKKLPSEAAYFTQDELWIAHYKVKEPDVPALWKTWRLWQPAADGDGKAYGVESNGIDVDYFHGSKAEFEAWAGGYHVVTQPPPATATTASNAVSVFITYSDGRTQQLP